MAKPRGKPFQKGKPGGPGRPPGSRNGSNIAKEWADQYGFDFLMRLAEGTEMFTHRSVDSKGKETVTKRTAHIHERAAAAIYLIDRAYGKPTAMHQVDIQARLTVEQLIVASRQLEAPLPAKQLPVQ